MEELTVQMQRKIKETTKSVNYSLSVNCSM